MERDIPPERFAPALGELMRVGDAFLEICNLIEWGGAAHYFRRALQINHGKIPLEHVPVANEIAMLKMILNVARKAHLTLVKLEYETRSLDDATLFLVPGSTSKKSGK